MCSFSFMNLVIVLNYLIKVLIRMLKHDVQLECDLIRNKHEEEGNNKASIFLLMYYIFSTLMQNQ